MVLFNYATKELTAKIVYYGPGLCGKTTNLQFIHQNLPETVKGKMLSLATKTDRTLFFDFLPLDLGEIRGMKTRVQLYTVPGQVFYNETRKLVLKGVDGVVFVADSQQEMMGPNVESFKNLEDNLKGHGLILADLPHVIQFNKRDLPKLASIEEVNAEVNKYNAPFYESVATTGIGVKDTLNAITKLVLLHLTKKYGASASAAETQPAAAVPPPATVPIAAVPLSPAAGAPMMAAAGGEAAVGAPGTKDGATLGPVTIGPAEDLPNEPPAPKFAEAEIDELVSEVQTAGVAIPAEPSEPPTLVEEPLPAGAERAAEPAVEETPTVEIPAEELDDPPIAQETEITLTEAASDDDLFEDPNLEIARMAPGEAREIVIPVEVGSENSGARRFKLTLRLHLDPID
jgi:signal recognition particle receptor subunit beta